MWVNGQTSQTTCAQIVKMEARYLIGFYGTFPVQQLHVQKLDVLQYRGVWYFCVGIVCKICMEHTITHVMESCGHASFCDLCYQNLLSRSSPTQSQPGVVECPMCRSSSVAKRLFIWEMKTWAHPKSFVRYTGLDRYTGAPSNSIYSTTVLMC